MDKKVITFCNIEIEKSNFDRVCRYDVIHASSMGYFSEKVTINLCYKEGNYEIKPLRIMLPKAFQVLT